MYSIHQIVVSVSNIQNIHHLDELYSIIVREIQCAKSKKLHLLQLFHHFVVKMQDNCAKLPLHTPYKNIQNETDTHPLNSSYQFTIFSYLLDL